MADGKRPFLKKGASLTRFRRQRSVALNPPPSALPAAETSSSENSQTAKQSLPLIEGIRPTTAETGHSGVRDINLKISPSDHSGSLRNTGTAYNQEPPSYADSGVSNRTDQSPPPAAPAAEISSSKNPQISPSNSGSVRTTLTTYNRESPPIAPAETNFNESEGEDLAQQYVQINPTSARIIEKHGPDLISGSSSRTNSYTSLDRIRSSPIGNHTKENESPELSSNNSVEIYAPSRSKGSTSVGTSAAYDASNETENNDSVDHDMHDSSGANEPSRLDSSLQFYGIFDNNNNHSLPPTQYQHHDDTPLNSKRHGPHVKSHSSSSLLYKHHRKPQSYFGRTARRFGIAPVPKYVLPPRPKHLESPTPPQASSTNIFCHNPMLSENFVKNEDGKIVESLAEQLRALLVCIDVGMDERRLRVKRVT
uniref:Uncharacterized protein n=1 Tax=Panagrolaimus davidi TaxID=227884 RepID=A0A914PPV5_9BILA